MGRALTDLAEAGVLAPVGKWELGLNAPPVYGPQDFGALRHNG